MSAIKILRFGRCNCKGRDGKIKKLYQTYAIAKEKAYEAKENRHVHLNVYECPMHLGFHLTSNQHMY